jgi:hypothetical protein
MTTSRSPLAVGWSPPPNDVADDNAAVDIACCSTIDPIAAGGAAFVSAERGAVDIWQLTLPR